jgi:hypothetical protein
MMREFDEVWRGIYREQSRRLNELKTQTEITKNSLEIQKLHLEIQRLEREEEIAKREAYKKWLGSDEGKAAIQREKDKRRYLKDKSIEFLFNRPYAIIFKKNIGGSPTHIDYKNYVSILYWIFFIVLGISMGGISIIPAILMAMILVLAFYFIRFELGLV